MSNPSDFSAPADPEKEPTIAFYTDIEGARHAAYPPDVPINPNRCPPLPLGEDTRYSEFSEAESFHNPQPTQEPIVRNRKSRSNTVWGTFPAVIDNPHRPAWEPGQEPGLDPSKPNGGRDQQPSLHADCDITIVEFSEDNMVMRNLNNHSLPKWIRRQERKEREGKDDWVKCRWINVNGLSWDVIQVLGSYKKLHRLAVEDMVNTKNRTKADWYPDQTFMILTLQKLVKLPNDDSDSSDSDDDNDNIEDKIKGRGFIRKARDNIFGKDMPYGQGDEHLPEIKHYGMDGLKDNLKHNHSKTFFPQPRTLQRYHGGPNLERIAFMEERSALTRKNLAVCAEQVSLFLLGENTVISFFESAGADIEKPIIKRLAAPETILRRSCDASMLVQAIIDAIIDLAMPISTTYSEIIQELELDVLTDPSIHQSRELYILTSEVTTMRNFISPIATLVRTVRDHKVQHDVTLITGPPNPRLKPSSIPNGVEISSMSHMYLADVEDHTLSILSDLDQLLHSSRNLISLIFNTISALQNESMKQLTTATIIFLPLTFITGYFGMNFEFLSGLEGNGDGYFWQIAAPVAVVTIVSLMWGAIRRYVGKMIAKWGRRRRRILRERKGRRRRERRDHGA